jgi:tRNA 2-thiouridine synthesizing protein E
LVQSRPATESTPGADLDNAARQAPHFSQIQIPEVVVMAISVEVDGEGFLVNRDDWSEAVARELATSDEFEINDQIMGLILKAREMYDADGVVPPIRIFAKKMKVSTKDLYDIFKKGPMKLICKWGGLPKPTGCV